jgi:putative phosphoribosyl transferase
MSFRDRADAGRRLAELLTTHHGWDPVVLALPRGGVPVAAEVADVLATPLDVILVRKLGLPQQPELAMGAIGEHGVRVLNDEVIDAAGTTPTVVAEVERRERTELEARAVRYRSGRAPQPIRARTVIVVDDGMATGSTARAAIQVARQQGVAEVVLAVPVAPSRTVDELAALADLVVCVEMPSHFGAVGQFYDDFSPTSEDEVIRLLAARVRPPA